MVLNVGGVTDGRMGRRSGNARVDGGGGLGLWIIGGRVVHSRKADTRGNGPSAKTLVCNGGRLIRRRGGQYQLSSTLGGSKELPHSRMAFVILRQEQGGDDDDDENGAFGSERRCR